MKLVHSEDVRAWYTGTSSLAELVRSIGQKKTDPEYLERTLGMPAHLCFLVSRLMEEEPRASTERLPKDALDSISFYSLCRGLFLPLSGLSPEKAGQLFGITMENPPDAKGREELLRKLLKKPIGLSAAQKLGCVLGDPYQGRRGSTFRRDSLLRLLMSVRLMKRSELLDRLTQVGDIAVVFAEGRPQLKEQPPLTSAEVLECLARLPGQRRSLQFDVLRSLLLRSGKLEAYFLAKLLMRKAGFGFDYQGPLLARLIADQFKADEGQVAHAVALTDYFHVIRILNDEGPPGLRAIHLQPLVPVRPALAGGNADLVKQFPVWVERKYDGIRLMLHKSTDARGAVLCGAYTRNRHDWLELVPGLDVTIKMLPARNVIVDGELFGVRLDLEGARPASVYEVYARLQGNSPAPLHLKYAAFDLLYLEGNDLTGLPLMDRRQRLGLLIAPLAGLTLPVPVSLSEGQSAANKDDLNRLYHHFRAQGYEGIIAKDPGGVYRLAERDPSWMKRKPEITLDLVLLGAVLAVTTKEQAGMFGSYVIGARKLDGAFEIVGDVAGVDKVRDAQIQAEIMREGLLTGRRIERPSASGVRPGYELRPDIVATVKFEGVTRDAVTGRLSLRDPKLAVIRSDKAAPEADTVEAIDRLYLDQRIG